MTEVPNVGLPAIPEELLLTEAVPQEAVFFGTNAALGLAVQAAIEHGRAALISSLVYAELTRRNPSPKGLGALDVSLLRRGIRVVPFDARAARCFFDLCRRLNFEGAPLCREKETARQCTDRVRFDLAVFAGALAWRVLLVTDNHRDFLHFSFRTYWSTTEDFRSQPNLRP